MARSDDAKPAMPRRNSTRLTGFTPEAEEWMAVRSQAIQAGTQRRGMPHCYGDGKPKKVPPRVLPKEGEA
jgi:hypothetical protein